MRDIMGMMAKAKELQQKMQDAQAELEQVTVQGAAGGGLVQLTLTAKGDLRGLKIDPSLLKPEDVEILEDLIVAAHADAKAKAEAAMQEKMSGLTAGLPIPPGMKLF
ncbi:DNA-binding YbaB/EbfC family protein [Methylopila capsulata]|uniref:Nucleoid-associated protein GCM10008170_10750 n=1 Tax=Methylopila capsulata TaxID=61654 RepID=A0A9W6ITZ5_9HYPH|nr:YbaB/EbfC family nucleoid-associated protein [Methylopila capsulata]MBM7851991.1 DNA-binding YbaB/EbfC family protein [Methylopila capsulata]GLK55056.1 nucleoid-associated protein [Methylopila capsulata]